MPAPPALVFDLSQLEPSFDLDGVEAEQTAELDVRNPPLGDKAPNMSVCHPELGSNSGDINQPLGTGPPHGGAISGTAELDSDPGVDPRH
jgi:hypothetical protein